MASYEIKPIRNAIVMLTNQCNCRCVYCFENRSTERMSLETAKAVLHFIHSSGTKNPGFTFFGGEPMLEFDTIIHPLVEYSKEAFNVPTRFAMTTNGTLFTKERLDFLKENDIRFMLSMDGAATAQNGNRPLANGENSFDKVMEWVPYILELWPNQSFRETLTKHNVSSLFDDILFFESIGCKNLMIVPDLFTRWSDTGISALHEQLEKYEDYLLRSYRAGDKPLLLHEYTEAFFPLVHIPELKRETPRRKDFRCLPQFQCGFGVRGSVSVNPLGEIYGCHHITPLNRKSKYFLGDVFHGLDEARVRTLVDSYDEQKVGNEMCAGCPMDEFCNGGCAPNNYMINGDEHRVPEMYCIWKRAITDSAYRIACTLGRENNETFLSDFLPGGTGRW